MSDVVGADTSLAAWLDAASRKQPTPGGGSAAALAGALSAAMGEMTLNYSVGRKANAPEQDQRLSVELQELNRARSLLLRLMEEDQAAYAAFTQARKRDNADPDKAAAVEAATAAAIRVPQAITAAALLILAAADRAARDANPWLLSDLAVCGELAMATVRCGGYNVKVNLGDLEKAEADHFREEAEAFVKRGVTLLQSLLATIDSRTSGKSNE